MRAYSEAVQVEPVREHANGDRKPGHDAGSCAVSGAGEGRLLKLIRNCAESVVLQELVSRRNGKICSYKDGRYADAAGWAE